MLKKWVIALTKLKTQFDERFVVVELAVDVVDAEVEVELAFDCRHVVELTVDLYCLSLACYSAPNGKASRRIHYRCRGKPRLTHHHHRQRHVHVVLGLLLAVVGLALAGA